jgi:hypothetical protein
MKLVAAWAAGAGQAGVTSGAQGHFGKAVGPDIEDDGFSIQGGVGACGEGAEYPAISPDEGYIAFDICSVIEIVLLGEDDSVTFIEIVACGKYERV